MYDYSDIYRRLKRNFHYAKCDGRLRARAMTMLRVLESINPIEGSGGHTAARILHREHGIKIAGSTVCAIFKRRGIRVRTPEHNGKVGRFNATLKRYL